MPTTVEIDTQAAYNLIQKMVADRMEQRVGPEIVRLAKSLAPVRKSEPGQKSSRRNKPVDVRIRRSPGQYSSSMFDRMGRPYAVANPSYTKPGDTQRQRLIDRAEGLDVANPPRGVQLGTPTRRTVRPFTWRLVTKTKNDPKLSSEAAGSIRRSSQVWQGVTLNLSAPEEQEEAELGTKSRVMRPRVQVGGALRNSIRMEPIEYDGHKVILTVRAYAPYARYVEFVRQWRPQKKHRPFLLPALKSVERRHRSLFRGSR